MNRKDIELMMEAYTNPQTRCVEEDLGLKGQVDRWLNNPDLQKFLQQVMTDISVGASKGHGDTIAPRVNAFIEQLRQRMTPRIMGK